MLYVLCIIYTHIILYTVLCMYSKLLTMQKQFLLPEILREWPLIWLKTALIIKVLSTIFRPYWPPKLNVHIIQC